MSKITNYEEIAKKLKKHIIEYNDFPVEEVKVPEWNLPFPIYIRTMSAKERDDFEARQIVSDSEGDRTLSLDNLRASMLVEVMCADPKGEYRIFNSTDDIIALGKKSAIALDRCITVSTKLNRTSQEDEVALLKNSKGQEGVSG